MFLIYLGLLIIILIIILIFIFYFIFKNNIYENFETLTTSNPLIVPTYNPFTFNNLPIETLDPIELDNLLTNSQNLIPSTNEINYLPLPSFNPVFAIASETNILNKLKEENNIIKESTKTKQDQLEIIQDQLLKIRNEIEKKEKEKLQLSQEIANMDNMRYISNTILSMIIKGIDATMVKEQELRNYENELQLKKEKVEKLLLQPIPTSSPVLIKEEQIEPIINKLYDLEKKFNDLNNKIPDNVCNLNTKMPEPQKEAFIFDINQVKNPSYLWCMCNDNNKNSTDCIDYMACNKNYISNKEKTSLIGDNLMLYMKCLSKYPNFPPYLTENNKK